MKIMSICLNKKVLGFLLLLSSLGDLQQHCFSAADPTDGFTRITLTSSNFVLQKPYDKSVEDRYSKIDNVEKFWVYDDDKPFKPDSDTRPRTEMRISGHDYTSGVWQFEGQFYVPQSITGVIIMQVFGAATEATALQLRIIDGNLMYYNQQVVAYNVVNTWVRLNVIHNVGAGTVTIFLNGAQKLAISDHGQSTHYFKYGAYAALTGSSHYMESSWKWVKVFKK